MKKLQTRKKDIRKILDLKVTTESNGLEKLRGLFTKRFKLGK